MSGICTILWALFASALFSSNALEARTLAGATLCFTQKARPNPLAYLYRFRLWNSKIYTQKPKKTGGSRYNEYHAGLAIALAKLVLADLPNECRKPEYIGIMTPYTAQRNCIKEQIQGTDVEVYCRVGTVHAYQGLEFDILIFDLVESPGPAIAPFLRGGWDPRRCAC